MGQLTEFITNHLVLVLLFLVISFLLIQNILTEIKQGNSIDTVEATRLINREDAIMLDIRNTAEFSDGHIANATNIPFSEFDNRTSDLEKLRDKPVIVCCKTGTSASLATTALKKLGFEKIYRLKGGIEGWKHASLPLAT